MQSSHTLDRLDIAFDDTHTVAAAGLLLPATVAERLGVEQAADQLIDLGPRPRAAHPGAKLLTLVHGILAGGDCIDDVGVLWCGSTATVLGHRVLASSTVGTFLRGFTFGHPPPAGPAHRTDPWPGVGRRRRTGPWAHDDRRGLHHRGGLRHHKQGAAYGYTHTLGYHPAAATRAPTPVRCCTRLSGPGGPTPPLA